MSSWSVSSPWKGTNLKGNESSERTQPSIVQGIFVRFQGYSHIHVSSWTWKITSTRCPRSSPPELLHFFCVFSEEWNVPINEAPKIKDLGKLSYNSNPWTFWTFFFWGDSLHSNHQHLGVTLPRKSYKIFLNQTWRGDFFVGSPQLLGRKNQGITQIQWDTTSDLALGGSLTNFTTHSQFSWGYKNTGKKRTNTSSKVGFTWFFMESLYNCWQI